MGIKGRISLLHWLTIVLGIVAIVDIAESSPLTSAAFFSTSPNISSGRR